MSATITYKYIYLEVPMLKSDWVQKTAAKQQDFFKNVHDLVPSGPTEK